MNRVRKTAFFLTAALTVAAPVHADTLSLDQAVEYALAHNPELTVADEEAAAAGAQTEAARGANKPRLDFKYSVRASDNPLDAFADKLNRRVVQTSDFDPATLNHPGTTTLNMTELSAGLPVYTGGRISGEIQGAEDNERAAQLRRQRSRQVVAARAAQAYLAAQAAARGVEIAGDAVTAARSHAQTTASLAAQGRIVQSDKLTAQVNLAAVQSQYEQALANTQIALNQLKLALGMPLDQDIDITAMAPPSAPDLATPVTSLEQQALGARADLDAMRRLVAAARSRVGVARAANRPQVNLVAGSTWYDNAPGFESHSWSVMGVLSQSLYNGGTASSRTLAAQHEVTASEARVLAQEQAIRNEIRMAHANLVAADARRALAKDNVDRAERTVALVRKRYGEGRTILIDLLQAERALVQARQERLEADLSLASEQVALRLAEGTP